MRHKIPDNKKKEKFTISIDDRLYNMLDKFLEENKHPNRSRYIEHLIKEDMEKRGIEVKKEL